MSQQTVADILSGGGVKPAKWDSVGTVHGGKVVSSEVVQARDIKDGTPKTWDDGSPVNQIRIIIQTDERDPEDADDDGQRALYLKGGKATKAVGDKTAKTSLEACKDALKAAGAKDFAVGATLTLQYAIDGERSNPGFNPPKLFVAKFVLPAVDPDSLI